MSTEAAKFNQLIVQIGLLRSIERSIDDAELDPAADPTFIVSLGAVRLKLSELITYRESQRDAPRYRAQQKARLEENQRKAKEDEEQNKR